MMRHSAFCIPRSAFTLVELMISMVLVLLLILGINQVFQMTSDAVGTGQAMSTITRDNRAAQSTIYNDFRVAVSPAASNRQNGDAPFFVIRSERQPAFRNRADELSDLDYDPDDTDTTNADNTISSRDLNANNNESDPGELPSVTIYDHRNHRIDRVMFFARDLFRRQTGGEQGVADNLDPFISPMSSTEAYIWYGHLNQPDNSGALAGAKQPGPNILSGSAENFTSNPNNFYATSWILGRWVMLLRAKDATTGEIYDNDDVAQDFIDRPTPSDSDYYDVLAPFSSGSQSQDNAYQVQWSRYDLGATTIAEFKDILSGYIVDWPVPVNEDAWWEIIGSVRYSGYRFPSKPHSSAGLARTVPVFLQACTQFMVEYAGDFLNQNADGTINASPTTDGLVDFLIDDGGTPTTADDVRKTRWYGFPRDVNGDGQVLVDVASPDVIPLRDLRPGGAASFERLVDSDGNALIVTPMAAGDDYATELGATDRYICAWGPDTVTDPMPTMLRITLAIDDPNGRVGEAQTYEYVINLP